MRSAFGAGLEIVLNRYESTLHFVPNGKLNGNTLYIFEYETRTDGRTGFASVMTFLGTPGRRVTQPPTSRPTPHLITEEFSVLNARYQ